jgi:hypothetical protein
MFASSQQKVLGFNRLEFEDVRRKEEKKGELVEKSCVEWERAKVGRGSSSKVVTYHSTRE